MKIRQAASALAALLCLVALSGCFKSDPISTAATDGATASSSSTPSTPKLQRVSLLLNWMPEAEHGGYFAAKVQGFFREEGLEVEILPGGAGVPVIPSVASRRYDFSIANADQVLLGRAQDADVVAIFAPLQQSPRCIMVRADSGIERFEDLRDMTLALGVGKSFTEFLKKKLPLENVKIVPYTGGISQFLAEKRFGQQAYVFSEPYLAEQAGTPARSLMLSDLGFNPYTSLLITHGETARQNPDLVKRMVRAAARGWKAYLDSPEAANQQIQRLNPEMDLKTLAHGAEQLRPLCWPEGAQDEAFGLMTPERWKEMAEQLVEIEALAPGRVDPMTAFTNILADTLATKDQAP